MTHQKLTVTREAARQFLAERHLLAPPRSAQGGPEAVMEVFRRLGSIQFDPIAVAGRNHDLVLHARVAEYDPVWCDELLYRSVSCSRRRTRPCPWFQRPSCRGTASRGPKVGSRRACSMPPPSRLTWTRIASW